LKPAPKDDYFDDKDKDEEEHDQHDNNVNDPTPKPRCETGGMPWQFPFQFEPSRIYFYGKSNTPSVDSRLNFDPSKPTLLYVHGLEAGTTARGYRETFCTPTGLPSIFPTLSTGDMWLDRGYNIGMFYWNQFSDDNATAVERKMYVGGDMNWARKSLRTSDSTTSTKDVPGEDSVRRRPSLGQWEKKNNEEKGEERGEMPCIADQLVAEIVRYFGEDVKVKVKVKGAVRVVGHSMGAQLVLEAVRRLSDRSKTETRALAAVQAIDRLVLLDPYFGYNRHAFEPMDGLTTAQRAAQSLATLSMDCSWMRKETYILSLLGEGWLGSGCTAALREHTVYSKVALPDVCWMDVAQRHCMAHHFYMCSILDEEGKEEKEKEEKEKEEKEELLQLVV